MFTPLTAISLGYVNILNAYLAAGPSAETLKSIGVVIRALLVSSDQTQPALDRIVYGTYCLTSTGGICMDRGSLNIFRNLSD
jgi:hypothetical protein